MLSLKIERWVDTLIKLRICILNHALIQQIFIFTIIFWIFINIFFYQIMAFFFFRIFFFLRYWLINIYFNNAFFFLFLFANLIDYFLQLFQGLMDNHRTFLIFDKLIQNFLLIG